MFKYIIRRILQMIPVLIGATFLIWSMVYAIPTDPFRGRCGDRPCPEQYVQAMRREYHMDEPKINQYLWYLGKLLRGDFGVNFYDRPVISELGARYPVTLKLAIIALLFEAILGIAAGIAAGINKGKFVDNLVTVSTLVVISIPVFVIGSLLQLVFGVNLRWFPVTAGSGKWSDLILPGIVLGALSLAYIARLTRTNLVENLRADYVRTAKAKGLSWGRTVGVHTFRNSLIPVITFIGYDFGSLMGGAIVTERIFNIPGIGSYIYRSIVDQDGTSVVGAITCLVLIYMIMNLIIDILYGFLDPRISNE